jgi:hypothetical protein
MLTSVSKIFFVLWCLVSTGNASTCKYCGAEGQFCELVSMPCDQQVHGRYFEVEKNHCFDVVVVGNSIAKAGIARLASNRHLHVPISSDVCPSATSRCGVSLEWRCESRDGGLLFALWCDCGQAPGFQEWNDAAKVESWLGITAARWNMVVGEANNSSTPLKLINVPGDLSLTKYDPHATAAPTPANKASLLSISIVVSIASAIVNSLLIINS